MSGSLSVAITAASSPKDAIVDSDEVGRSAVYSRYRSGPRTLPWGTLVFSIFIFNLEKKVSATQVGFYYYVII
jgi:hypothetical protein